MDSNEDVRDSLSSALALYGYETHAVKDSVRALTLLETARKSARPYDVVIVDLVSYGGKSWANTIKEMRNIDSGVKAIIASGFPTDPAMKHFKKYGLDGEIKKPYHVEDLDKLIQSLILGEKYKSTEHK